MRASTANPSLINRHWLQPVGIVLLGWLAALGFDFFLHAGVLAKFYVEPSPFLLPTAEAFRRIPIGYLSFLLYSVLLMWLMPRLAIQGARTGFAFGAQLGALLWGATTLGILSVSTADPFMLLGWFVGQTFELAIMGAIIGSALAGTRLTTLVTRVVVFAILMGVLTILLQSLGLAPAIRL